MILSRITSKTNNTTHQFIRYLFVGGAAFCVDYFILNFFTEILEIHYLISQIYGFIAGLFVNYLLSIKWVFSNRSLQNSKHEFLIFTFIGIIGLLINTFILWTFKEYIFYTLLNYVPEHHQRYSKLIATGVVFLWNFFARKLTLFK